MSETADRLPRPLDPVEVRVIGALLEKERATPEQYPLSVAALLAACNQRTNRDPVLDLREGDVLDALDRLKADVFVRPAPGARTLRWRVSVEHRWGVSSGALAALTLLMLRGPQTAGEIRGRSERLYDFPSIAAAEEALAELARGAQPLATRLPRRPGQKEERWAHLISGPVDERAPVLPAPTTPPRGGDQQDRLAAIEARLARIEAAMGLRG